MTNELANKIYDVLVSQAGAREAERNSFVYDQSESASPAKEWRFQCSLGFGGKYWPERNQISCYSEDETEERNAFIAKINEELSRLK